MRKDTPMPGEIIKKHVKLMQLENIGKSSIRQIKRLVDNIEQEIGLRYIRMEMGIPGLNPSEIGIKAEIEALEQGVASLYPDIEGIKPLKYELSRFLKLFMDININPDGCIPTVGSMQASFASFLTCTHMYKEKNSVLFLDPGFPVHKSQCNILGIPYKSFDVYEYRGEKIRSKLESMLSSGNISVMLYSNPNNPAWICFTDHELQIIGELAEKYNVIVLEDLAYFGMDFRKDISKPGEPPYQSTVAKYNDNYIILFSSAKAFSYAGQRIGAMCISDRLFNTKVPHLKKYFGFDVFGRAVAYGAIYALCAGITHSSQCALTALLKNANAGSFNFLEPLKEYGERAKIMKKMFTENGFKIVYDKDEDQPLADGFYFTISYPGFTGEELIEELIYYGISAISLAITGSSRTEGLRACVSLVGRDQFQDLKYRVEKFYEHHPL